MNGKNRSLALSRCLLYVELICSSVSVMGAQDPSPAANSHSGSSTRYGSDFFAGKNPLTAFDMVNMLPGFTFSTGDSTIRGYAESAGNVLIDSQRVSNKQFTLESVLQHITADEVDYIEVIEGGSPGVEMLGQSVVANVVRRRQAGDKVVLTATDALFEDGRDIPGGTLEWTSHWSGGRRLTSAVSASKYVELAEGNGPDVTRGPTGHVLNESSVTSAAGGLNAYAYGTFSKPAWKGILAINGSSARTDYNYREHDDVAAPESSSNDLHEHLGGPLGGQLQNELGAHFSRQIGEKWATETNALGDYMSETYSSLLEDPGAAERFFLREHVGETLIHGDLRSASNAAVAAEFGAEAAYNWLGTQNSFTFNSFPAPLPNANARVSELRDQVSGNVIWTQGKRLQVELGAKMENSLIKSVADTRRSKELTYLKPRVVMSIAPQSANHVRIRIEHEVSQLDFSNFVAASSLNTGSIRSGNTDIVPQQDWVFEGLYEHHFWSDGDFVATYRHFQLSDVLDRVAVSSASDPSAFFDAAGNIGAGREDSLALNFTASLDHLGAKNAQLKVTTLQQWSRIADPTTGSQRPISGLDPLEYAVELQQDIPKWHVKWDASFLSPCAKSTSVKGCTETTYRFNEVDAYRATPTANIFAEMHVSKSVLIHLEADNLARQHYGWVISRYTGPRNDVPLQDTEGRYLSSFSSVLFSIRKEF